MTNNMQVANTILQQLGGNRFLVMTGAKNLLGDEKSLHFKVGRNDAKVTHVRITFNGLDLYDVEFFRVAQRGLKVETLSSEHNVHVENLRDVFTAGTGLATSL